MIKGIYCDNKSLSQHGYCSYYGETYYALKEVLDIEYKQANPSTVSEIGSADYIILGYGLTDCGYGSPSYIRNDTNIPVFPIINKEYASLSQKLDWVKNMKATAAFSVHHDIDSYSKYTGIPFHRIMWSANQKQFRDYGGDYKHDLFFSGVVRKEQTGNLRERVLSQLDRLSDYKLFINARTKDTNFSGKMFSDEDYARCLSDSKICFITTGPADLVGTRYFEVMASNRSLIICNRMSQKVYGDMLIDGYNCVMFSTVDEFYDQSQYYLNNEDDRMKIVNKAHEHFIETQTWNANAIKIKIIIEEYVS